MLHKILFVVFSFSALTLSAQKKVLKQRMFNDLEVTNSITKSYQDSTLTFHLKVLDDDQNPDFSKRYFWFHQGEIKSTVGNYTGKLLHGPYEKYDRDGTLLEKGNFEYGLKDGAWLSWYQNGNVSQHYNWNKGLRNGKFEEYFADGSKLKSGVYKNDKLHGIVYQYQQGAVVEKIKYRKGVLVKEKVKKVKAPKENSVEPKKEKRSRKKKGEEIATTPSDQQTIQPATEKSKKKKKEKKTSVQNENQQPTEAAPTEVKKKKEKRKKKEPATPEQQPQTQP
jgi:hypothetical protein